MKKMDSDGQDLVGCQADLRCMHGLGLCLWRAGRFDEAERIFERMLWLNPSDNQGARFLLNEVRSKTTWEKSATR